MSGTNEYILNLMSMLLFLGALIKIFFGTEPTASGTNGPASSAICGYGVMSIAVFILLFLNISLGSNINSASANVSSMMQGALPSMCMLVVLTANIILNTQNYEIINKGDVPHEFNQFSTLSTIIIMFQAISLTKYVRDLQDTSTASEAIVGVSAVLTVLNLIFVSVMHTIITYFVTDG